MATYTPKVFTKELAAPFLECRGGRRVRISSNLLPLHGFKPGARMTKCSRQDGPGFVIKLANDGEQVVYSRGYRGRTREAVIEVGEGDWVQRLMGAERVQIVSRPGVIQVSPVPDFRFHITRKVAEANGFPMFSVLSSGMCASAFTEAGFSPRALCEWRPPEKRDVAMKRDLTESGASTALRNVPFETVFNQDVFSLTDSLLDDTLGGDGISIVAGSLQCDSFSNLKSARLKESIREAGTPGDAELLYPVLRLIEKTQPAIVFIENVPFFLNSELGGVFKAVLNRTGYFVKQAVLNGADFGTRCSRPRGFIVASVWPGYQFPVGGGRATGSLYDWLGGPIMAGCRDVTDSNIVARAKAKNRLRKVVEDASVAPVFPKSQNRVDDRVLFEQGGRLLDPSIVAMRKIHGLPPNFDLGHLPQEQQVEQIGQGVDYVLLTLLAKGLLAHMKRNIGHSRRHP